MEERIKDPVLKDVSLRLGLYGDAVKKLVALSGEIREKTENDRQEAFCIQDAAGRCMQKMSRISFLFRGAKGRDRRGDRFPLE